jgi:tRNA dimethylallyltransferase
MIDPTCFQRCLVLTGPTGSGKSALALDLAERLDAEIVAMDAMTLYRGFDIGTAKPTSAERARVPHHLIDVLEPWESGSVAWWLERAAARVGEIESRGRLVLFVGGSPLYLKSLLYGLFRGPRADPNLRQTLEGEAKDRGTPFLHGRLKTIDPISAAKVNPNDLRRIVRALEVWELTGKPISTLQTEWQRPRPSPGPDVVCLDVPRVELYERIDRRVLAMLDAGWLDEARRLRASHRPPSRESSAAVGYQELWDHLDGKQSLADATARIQQRTRNYAKRQLTWFRALTQCHFATAELTTARWHQKMT